MLYLKNVKLKTIYFLEMHQLIPHWFFESILQKNSQNIILYLTELAACDFWLCSKLIYHCADTVSTRLKK